jgi:hypothetical protein
MTWLATGGSPTTFEVQQRVVIEALKEYAKSSLRNYEVNHLLDVKP